MSGRRRATLSPSLFPFLAVLVCTLGTLILLLALVSQNSTEAAIAAVEENESKEEQPEASPHPKLTVRQVNDLIEEEEFRTQEFISMREEQTGDLEDRRDKLTHLEDHIRRIRLQLKNLSDQLELAEQSNGDQPIDESTIEEIRLKVLAGKEELEQLREKSKNKTPRVVIVPHKGPNGTDRRPIYIECHADGVTIWPEGTKIELVQLEETTRDANPLDSALRVARFRALQDYGDQVAPYPMLIVRPDGVVAYSNARAAMKDWDDQFGYELVPAEVDLAYSKPDPELKRRMDDAVRQAVIKQYGLQSIASRRRNSFQSLNRSRPSDSRFADYGTGSRAGSGAADELSGVGGSGASGPAGPSANPAPKPLPRLSAAQMDRQGRSNGFQDHRVPVGSRFSGSYGANDSMYAAGTGNDATAELDKRIRQAASDLAAEGGLPNDVLGGTSSFGNGLAGETGSPDNTAISQLSRDPSPGNQQQSNPYATAGTSQSNVPPGDRYASSASSSLSLNGPINSSASNSAQGQAGQDQASQGSAQNSPGGPNANGPNANGQSSAGQQNPMASNNPNSSAGASTRSGQSMMPQPSEPSSQPTDPSDFAATPANQTSANQSSTKGAGSGKQVSRRGANWALPRDVALSRGNAIVRTIKVRCYPDYFVLVPSSRSGEKTKTFLFTDGEVKRATLELATAVRDRIQSWGAALPGGRWQPMLDVQVMDRGDHRFHQLRTLMSGSGIDIRRSSPADAAPIPSQTIGRQR